MSYGEKSPALCALSSNVGGQPYMEDPSSLEKVRNHYTVCFRLMYSLITRLPCRDVYIHQELYTAQSRLACIQLIFW